MFRRYFSTVLIVLSLSFAISALADEGMWPLNKLNMLNWQELQQRGMQLSPQQVQDLQQAVVLIDGGTGEFVSSTGLVLTNHHVAFGAIQFASDVDHNYIDTGFYAASKDQEIPIPSYNVMIPKAVKDVTAEVLAAVSEKMSPLERSKAIAQREAQLEKKSETNEFIEARVVSMYNGLEYDLVTYTKYKDVRLVYAPPQSIGNYGGDIDNWMWPRHTGDFSFFRVYAKKDGKPAKYDKENVPLTPPKYLSIDAGEKKKGDFTFIMGYPGSTYRYRTSYSLQYNQDIGYPTRIDMYQTALDVLDREAANSPEVAIKVSSFAKGLNNGLKNNQGMVSDFKQYHLVDRKREFEKRFTDYIDSNPDLKNKYGTVLDEIGARYADLNGTGIRDAWLGFFRFVRLPNTVYTAYRYAMEKEKPADNREPGFTKRDIQRRLQSMKYSEKDYVPDVDREMLKAFLIKLAELPDGQHVQFVDDIVAGKTGDAMRQAIDSYVNNIFDNTQYKTFSDVTPLFDKSLKEMKGIDDPMVQFAQQMAAVMIPYNNREESFNGAIEVLRAKYIEGLEAWQGNNIYPDANRTLRLTYGDVEGYSPKDAVFYFPFTTLKGVVQLNTGEVPFNAPQKLMNLEKQKDFGSFEDLMLKDVPVDFLSTTDITGGNSGSPVLNGKGQLIGVAFDGNYESISADYVFIPENTRSINVDSRYILFILDKFSNAQNLLKELDLVQYSQNMNRK